MSVATIGDRFDRSKGFRHGTPKNWAFFARRAGLSGAIIAGHLLILLVVLHSSGLVTVRPAERRLVAIDISAAAEPSLPAAAAEKPRIATLRTVQLVLHEHTAPVPPTAGGNGSGSGCAMTAAVARAISESPDAMAALAALPAGLRTEADAVMLWNGEWLPPDEPVQLTIPAAAHPMDPLKQVVLEAVRDAPPECLEVETAGPQLIPIAEPGRTTMLVVGSGRWRWSSLADPLGDPTLPQPQDQARVFWPIGGPLTGN